VKKLSLFILLFVFLCYGNMEVKADTFAYQLSCNGNESVTQTFTDDVIKCELSSVGSGEYNFKELSIKYQFNDNVSFVKFVPNEKWNTKTEQENGILLKSETGIPMNRVLGTIYLRVVQTLYGSRTFQVDLDGGEFDDTVSHTININGMNENRIDNIKISDGNLNVPFDSNIQEYDIKTSSENIKL